MSADRSVATAHLKVTQDTRATSESAAAAKLCLLVCRDLPWSVRSVQAAHAAVSFAIAHHPQLAAVGGPCGPPIVLLGVESEADLASWLRRLGPEAVPFHEPDLGGRLTAVAYLGSHVAGFATLRLL